MCCRRRAATDRRTRVGEHGESSACQMREVRCGSRMKMYTSSEQNTQTVTYQ